MNNTSKLAAIDRLTTDLPTFQCAEGCTACCGPVLMSRLELARILASTGKTAKEWLRETMLAIDAGDDSGHGNCPLLGEDGKCTVYDIRPAICRLFGVTDTPRLRCPNGGIAAALIPQEKANAILDQANKLGV